LLLIAATFGALCIIPIALDLRNAMLTPFEQPPIPLPLLVAIGIVQNLAILALVVWLGLKLSRRLGLRAPLSEALVSQSKDDRQRDLRIRPLVTAGLITGVAVGIVLLVSLLLLVPRLPNLPFVIAAKLPVWKRFLACFYGGIYEEVFTRLFLLSLVAWIANRSWRKTTSQMSNGTFWFANILVAILFGLGHLPSASLFMPITPLAVTAAIVLNGIAGISFGYLYRSYGLEAAMIAHFSADFMIYVVGPTLLIR
jgi:membrane protease YdiL (CAAX protease family)